MLSVRPGIHLIPRVLLLCRESPGIMFSKLICVLLEQVVLGFSCCRPVGAASVKVLSTSVIETILFPVWDLNPFDKNQESRALENQKLSQHTVSHGSCSLYTCSETITELECVHPIKPEQGFSGSSFQFCSEHHTFRHCCPNLVGSGDKIAINNKIIVSTARSTL